MSSRFRFRRPVIVGFRVSRSSKNPTPRKVARPRNKPRSVFVFLFTALVFVAVMISLSSYVRELTYKMAVSEARDKVTYIINETINNKMANGDFEYNYFVNLEKDSQGNITALTTNMARINALSAEIMGEVLDKNSNGEVNVKVPIGSLMGLSILSGRGPGIPVKVLMLTTSSVSFHNELSSAGINQTRHQIMAYIDVDLSIIVPGETVTTSVSREIMVAETIIVGRVPDSFLNLN